MGKTTWFQPSGRTPTGGGKGKNREKADNTPARAKVESVLYVQYTPNSALKKQLQDLEDKHLKDRKTGRIRVMERLGPSTLWTPRMPPLQDQGGILQGKKLYLPDSMPPLQTGRQKHCLPRGNQQDTVGQDPGAPGWSQTEEGDILPLQALARLPPGAGLPPQL